MQSLQQLTRSSLRKCAVANYQARNFSKPVGSQKREGFFRKVVTDSGNWPIICANVGAATMIVIFSLRKVLYHPDVTFTDENRFSPEVQNETASRLDHAQTFRDQTRFFARILYQPTMKILKLYTGSDPSEKFHLNFVKDTEIPLPLEQTDFFHDGLYEGIESQPFAENIMNDTDFIGRIKDKAT